MFMCIDFDCGPDFKSYLRGVARLLGFRGKRLVVHRTPPSAR